jgi:NADPH:quinone reductase-like Zn-dependent oxidoreductase
LSRRSEDAVKAAVVSARGAAPRYADFDDPVPGDGERPVHVTAAALHPVVRALAGGGHYASHGVLPMIPGVDGTGRLPDGTRVYFGGIRSPFGSMAELAAAPAGFCVPLPDELDDATVAAIMNPGMAAWLALTHRAELRPGQAVLVLGATGTSGRIAVALAGQLGARRVLAAGRNATALETLGATATIPLGGDDDAGALAAAIGEDGVDVIVDYLWGPPTEAAIAAISRRGLAHAGSRVRLVDVGQAAAATITLPADVLRSSALELLGTGVGTMPIVEVVKVIPTFLAYAATARLPIDVEEAPLAEVESVWRRAESGRRVVFRP